MKRWDEIDALLGAALRLPPEEIAEFLAASCGNDAKLRRTVEDMLEAALDPTAGIETGGALNGPLGKNLLDQIAVDEPLELPRVLSHYELLDLLGAGGMGMVYRARDTTLGRDVAIKLVRADARIDDATRERFRREAKTASALNHPGIVTVHEWSRTRSGDRDVDFMVMEHVDGSRLDELLTSGGLPLERAIDYGVQIASALAAAHEVGIVHRDLKPSNIIITQDGRAKVLDFGIAKLLSEPFVPGDVPDETTAETADADQRTRRGTVLGTAPYMSPEQARGHAVDARSDVFSFGTLMYELVTGARAFPKATSLASAASTLGADRPVSLSEVSTAVPVELERIVARCLEKEADARYPSGRELHSELDSLRELMIHRPRRRKAAAWVSAVVAAAVAFGAWVLWSGQQTRWAREEALPAAERLMEDRRLLEASVLLEEIREVVDAPEVEALYLRATRPVSLSSDPAGAKVYIRDYRRNEQDWLLLGTTPIVDTRVPAGYLRFKVLKEGHAPLERVVMTWTSTDSIHYKLYETGAAPTDMVRFDGVSARRGGDSITLDGFWLDRFEVTNRQFQTFVDAGGYERREFWKEPFVRDGVPLSWEESVAAFVDRTGRPGPSGWELGRFPEGRGEFPVGGVSWYEAAAYAEFVGKKLPTIYHWFGAAGIDSVFSDILFLSNLGGKSGAAPVGRHEGLGPHGTYDMAGNVKEWCHNQSGTRRTLLGGAWNEPLYAYTEDDAQDPFQRSETNGFRCARYDAPLDETLRGPYSIEFADFRQVPPVSDQVFEHYRRLYDYDSTELRPSIERVESTSRQFRQETVTVDTSYGERLPIRLYLPHDTKPPYQAVVYFPGIDARMSSSSDNDVSLSFIDFIPRSGRVLVWPIYKGHYERGGGVPTAGPNSLRDLYVAMGKDYRRVLDYLETRDDVDAERIGYLGLSLGAAFGAVLNAIDDRQRASVWIAAGADVGAVPPEIEGFYFSPRVKTPTVFINGRYDFVDPVETSQQPLFDVLGTSAKDKRFVLVDAGHIPPQRVIVKESLAWFDRYLGPVDRDAWSH